MFQNTSHATVQSKAKSKFAHVCVCACVCAAVCVCVLPCDERCRVHARTFGVSITLHVKGEASLVGRRRAKQQTTNNRQVGTNMKNKKRMKWRTRRTRGCRTKSREKKNINCRNWSNLGHCTLLLFLLGFVTFLCLQLLAHTDTKEEMCCV